MNTVESIVQLIEDEQLMAERMADGRAGERETYGWNCRAVALRELLDLIEEEA